MEAPTIKASGLKWRKRGDGRWVPYWISDDEARRAGYEIKTVPLGYDPDRPELLVQRCERLQAEMRLWVSDNRSGTTPTLDRTFGGLIATYLRDPESSYRTLEPGALHPYTIYAAKLKKHVGETLIENSDGRDVKKWFKVWADVDDLRDPAAHLPRARMMLTVLKAVVKFGVLCKHPACAPFKAVLDELEFPSPKRREFAPTAAQIVAVRAAAHAEGSPSRALAYALQFETSLRQWDVIGQWLPMSDPRPSTLHDHGMKWIGPTWANIDEHMILRVTPTKTEGVTDVHGTFDLKLCPMVMEEIALISSPSNEAGKIITPSGPLIAYKKTGLPYRHKTWLFCWRRDFKAAGLPKKMWNRDLRAGASTEASKGGATREDRAKVAGHSPEMQGKVYDRDEVESFRRVRTARNEFRAKNDPGT